MSSLFCCAIWLLCASLVSASVDATPDPPVVSQHETILKLSCVHKGIISFCQHGPVMSVLDLSGVPFIRFLTFTTDHKFSRSNRWLVVGRHAADSSPPVL